MRGATRFRHTNGTSRAHFNPRTPCGVRLHCTRAAPSCVHFNPRTPCGVRRLASAAAVHDIRISIHAPRAGCDRGNISALSGANNFNPRTPCGVRLLDYYPLIDTNGFQSTHPVRGATSLSPLAFAISLKFQSTHPVRGATLFDQARNNGRRHFNPRTPCGVRPRRRLFCSNQKPFQSTHPVRGATRYVKQKTCDERHFNPRTPCGVRLLGQALDIGRCLFQSTHPVRGATRSDT